MSTPPPLPGALGSLAPVLDHYGYLAVAGLIMLEDFGIPGPGETVLIAAAVDAGTGRLNIPDQPLPELCPRRVGRVRHFLDRPACGAAPSQA
jgi:hypothetical protein